MKIHKNVNNKFSCPLCDSEVKNALSLRNHYMLHSDFPVPQCPYPTCNARFCTKRLLDTHISSHHRKNEKDYPCDLCGKRLKVAYGLLLHMRLKHGKFVLTLSRCTFISANLRNLNFFLPDLDPKEEMLKPRLDSPLMLKMPPSLAHHSAKWREVYGREDAFRCCTCKMAFNNQSLRLKHFLNVHEREIKSLDRNVYPCIFCSKVFYESEVFHTHIQLEHKKKLENWLDLSADD